MYIQITTRCNMSCAHCCFNCTNKGIDMPESIFLKALKLCEDDYITIGGGEPTIHPKFWNYLINAIVDCEGVWLATNGSQTKTALKLASLAKKGIIGCALSQDDFHDNIDNEVIQAFTKNNNLNTWHNNDHTDDREIRNLSENIFKAGRALENEIWNREGCVCNDRIIKPDGSIYLCGCSDSIKIGDVDNYDEKYDDIYCCKELNN